MVIVKVLIKGYTSADSENDEERTCPTISLVKSKDLVIVVDPGVLKDINDLIQALKNESLEIEDATHVFLTYSHIDHYRNVGIFPNAKVIEFYGIWEKDTVDDWPEKLNDKIEIIETPGHDGMFKVEK